MLVGLYTQVVAVAAALAVLCDAYLARKTVDVSFD